MIRHFLRYFSSSSSLTTSNLFNERTFYRAFEEDLAACAHEVVIESPFITTKRVALLLPILQKAINRGVNVTINTKDPMEHDEDMRIESEKSLSILQDNNIHILFTGGHHRKLAIFDREVLWEGSLNISQNDSCEVMRRIESKQLAMQMVSFTKLDKYLVKI